MMSPEEKVDFLFNYEERREGPTTIEDWTLASITFSSVQNDLGAQCSNFQSILLHNILPISIPIAAVTCSTYIGATMNIVSKNHRKSYSGLLLAIQ